MIHVPVRGVVAGAALCLALTFPTSVSAQTVIDSPLLPRGSDGIDGPTGLRAFLPNAGLVADLAAAPGDRVILSQFSMPDGSTVDLDLSRMDLNPYRFGFQVDGLPAPGLLSGLDLSLWKGTVVGSQGSDVFLSFSNRGISGWVQQPGDIVHVLPQPEAGDDWASSFVLLARDNELNERGLALGAFCAAEQVAPGGQFGSLRIDPEVHSGQAPETAAGTAGCETYECTIAVETDWQLNQDFNGDLGAETAFVTALLAVVSDRYVEQIDTQLTYPYVQFYTTSNDGWSTPDGPGSSSAMLDEFVTAWSGNIPTDAVIGHFLSGADLGGGIAYLSVLCDSAQSFSFAVSGNIDGDLPFPLAVGPLNWDFMVFAHETGHNFSSPHTHDYNPQIDDCAGGSCITNGTIMSYCHLCSGGTSNITLLFNEPTVVNQMKSHVQSCLPLLAPLVADPIAQPKLIAPGSPTTVEVTLQGTPVGTVDLQWRLGGGAFTSTIMTAQGGGIYAGDLPSTSCGDSPEWFFSVTDADCGFYQTATFAAEVGLETILAFDDFETNSGWTSGAAGDDATTGIWERGNPNGTSAQPENDVTNPGTDCWFTGQGSVGGSVGENDVDGGKTTLTTTNIDLSSGDARISYWRWYNNEAGSTPNTDVFTIDINNGGSWVNVETVGPFGDTGGGWVFHEFNVSDFVTPNGSIELRFVAADEGEGSIVEAAIDDFKVSRVNCGGPVVCQTDLGFGGPGTGALSICGEALASGNSADLVVTAAASNSTAILFAGVANSPTAFKGGQIVPVPWSLSVSLPLDVSGGLTLPVAGGNGPATFYVQVIYLDGAQAQGFGFTNALEVDLLP